MLASMADAADELLALVYAELRRLAAARRARESPGPTRPGPTPRRGCWPSCGARAADVFPRWRCAISPRNPHYGVNRAGATVLTAPGGRQSVARGVSPLGPGSDKRAAPEGRE